MTTTKQPNTEMVTRPSAAIEQPQRPTSLLEVIAAAVMNPAVDVAKMKELFALQREIEHDAAKKEFRAAKARVAKLLPQVGKDGRIIHNEKLISKYARLEDIDQAIRPLLAEEGFSFSFDSHTEVDPQTKAERIVYSGELAHRDGHAETKTLRVGIDRSGAKNEIQGVGSSTTYARRYLIEMHLNLIERGKDDDGNGGNMHPITKEHAAEIAKLLADAREAGLSGFSDERWLKFKQVTSFESLFERDYERLREGIKAKRVEAEQKAAESKK